ncbi:hypothetical protein ScalyP_jg5958, partial [Parmales sp. scaly parma]
PSTSQLERLGATPKTTTTTVEVNNLDDYINSTTITITAEKPIIYIDRNSPRGVTLAESLHPLSDSCMAVSAISPRGGIPTARATRVTPTHVVISDDDVAEMEYPTGGNRGKKILVVNRSYDTLVAQAMGSVFVVREEWMRASGEGRWAKEDGFEIFCDSTIYDMLCSESENASGKGWVTTMSRSLLSGGGGAFRNARLFEGQVGKGRARRMLRGVGVVVLDVIGIGVAEELSSDEDEEEMDVSNCKKSKSEEEEEEE